MCIAIIKREGTQIDDATLRHCFNGNKDGAGFALVTQQGLHIEKGFMDIESFLEAYHSFDVNAGHALVHFRITTRGSEGQDNCHPFLLKHGALVHNGTIWQLGEVGKGKSDTQVLADMLFEESFETIERLGPMIHHFIGHSRVGLMDHTGNALIFNRDDWKEESGVLFSNNNYKPWVQSGHVGNGSNYGYGRSANEYDYDDWGNAEGYSDATKAIVAMRKDRAANEEHDPYDYFWCDKSERLYRRNKAGFYVRDAILEKAALDTYWSYGGTTYEDLEYLTDELITEEEEESCHSILQSTEPSTESRFESSATHYEATIPTPSKSMVKL